MTVAFAGAHLFDETRLIELHRGGPPSAARLERELQDSLRWRIPDELWASIRALLPARKAHPLGCHNPRVDDRAAMDAILLVLRTGIRWKTLNEIGPCSSSSAHRRFKEWTTAGLFEELLCHFVDYEELRPIDWSWLRGGSRSRQADHHDIRPYRPRKPRRGRRATQ